MYTIGIDLAITAAHKAIVAGVDGKFVTPLLSFRTRWSDIQQLVARIRKDVPLDRSYAGDHGTHRLGLVS